MEITLPKAVLDELPAPDKNGLVRVTVALKVSGDKADVVEVNDTPVPGADEESGETTPDTETGEMPSPSDVAGQMTY